MNVDQWVLKRLQSDEGWRAEPYRCTEGRWTIGFGCVLPITNDERAALPDKGASPLTKRDGNALLAMRYGAAKSRLVAALHGRGEHLCAMPESVQAALLNMSYQLGVQGLMGFQRMLKAIRESRWADAAEHALDSRWFSQTPARAKRQAKLIRMAGSARRDEAVNDSLRSIGKALLGVAPAIAGVLVLVSGAWSRRPR